MTNLPFCGISLTTPRDSQKGSDTSGIQCYTSLPSSNKSSLFFLILHSSDRVERFGMREYYFEAHKNTANQHEFSKLSILRAFKNLCCKSHIMGGSARAYEAAMRNKTVDKEVDKIKYIILI